jgi:DNA-binding transcriptional ArsR family regulator
MVDMPDMPDISGIAALVGDPARARMLTALTSGTALTATELSLEAGILPSTASSHLGKLQDAGFLSMQRQGRHRYFRLAGPEIAELLEKLMGIAAGSRKRVQTGPRDVELRTARVCYDHLAGSVAVRFLAGLQVRALLVVEANGHEDSTDRGLVLTDPGRRFFSRLGIDVASLPSTRRPLCLACLDWSERRPHLAGALGAELLRHIYKERWATRAPDGRAVHFSPRGLRFFEALLSESDPKRSTQRPRL